MPQEAALPAAASTSPCPEASTGGQRAGGGVAGDSSAPPGQPPCPLLPSHT